MCYLEISRVNLFEKSYYLKIPCSSVLFTLFVTCL
uniref:Uncharacterized protein n=1 Tax=Anguilla anguilla TaxID=7936 RepID=A0A0E9Y0P2_ANGAN